MCPHIVHRTKRVLQDNGPVSGGPKYGGAASDRTHRLRNDLTGLRVIVVLTNHMTTTLYPSRSLQGCYNTTSINQTFEALRRYKNKSFSKQRKQKECWIFITEKLRFVTWREQVILLLCLATPFHCCLCEKVRANLVFNVVTYGPSRGPKRARLSDSEGNSHPL